MTEPTLITTQIELDRAFEESRTRPVVVFKHSARCSISAHSLGTYLEFVGGRPAGDDALFAVIDVLEARAASDALAQRSGIRHESPQAVLLRGGEVVWFASHWDITKESITEALTEAQA